MPAGKPARSACANVLVRACVVAIDAPSNDFRDRRLSVTPRLVEFRREVHFGSDLLEPHENLLNRPAGGLQLVHCSTHTSAQIRALCFTWRSAYASHVLQTHSHCVTHVSVVHESGGSSLLSEAARPLCGRETC